MSTVDSCSCYTRRPVLTSLRHRIGQHHLIELPLAESRGSSTLLAACPRIPRLLLASVQPLLSQPGRFASNRAGHSLEQNDRSFWHRRRNVEALGCCSLDGCNDFLPTAQIRWTFDDEISNGRVKCQALLQKADDWPVSAFKMCLDCARQCGSL